MRARGSQVRPFNSEERREARLLACVAGVPELAEQSSVGQRRVPTKANSDEVGNFGIRATPAVVRDKRRLPGEQALECRTRRIPCQRPVMLTEKVCEHANIQCLPRPAKLMLQSGIARQPEVRQGGVRRAGADHRQLDRPTQSLSRGRDVLRAGI